MVIRSGCPAIEENLERICPTQSLAKRRFEVSDKLSHPADLAIGDVVIRVSIAYEKVVVKAGDNSHMTSLISDIQISRIISELRNVRIRLCLFLRSAHTASAEAHGCSLLDSVAHAAICSWKTLLSGNSSPFSNRSIRSHDLLLLTDCSG